MLCDKQEGGRLTLAGRQGPRLAGDPDVSELPQYSYLGQASPVPQVPQVPPRARLVLRMRMFDLIHANAETKHELRVHSAWACRITLYPRRLVFEGGAS